MLNTLTTHLNQKGAETTSSLLSLAGYAPFFIIDRQWKLKTTLPKETRKKAKLDKKGSYSDESEDLLAQAQVVVGPLAVVHVVDEVDAVALASGL